MERSKMRINLYCLFILLSLSVNLFISTYVNLECDSIAQTAQLSYMVEVSSKVRISNRKYL